MLGLLLGLWHQEGDDPLPRRPDAWLRFNYYTPPANAKRSRPTMRGDGERAVAALVAAVARLKKRTDRALHQEQAAMGQVRRSSDPLLLPAIARASRATNGQSAPSATSSVSRWASKLANERDDVNRLTQAFEDL